MEKVDDPDRKTADKYAQKYLVKLGDGKRADVLTYDAILNQITEQADHIY